MAARRRWGCRSRDRFIARQGSIRGVHQGLALGLGALDAGQLQRGDHHLEGDATGTCSCIFAQMIPGASVAPSPAPAKCVMKRRRVSFAADMEPPGSGAIVAL